MKNFLVFAFAFVSLVACANAPAEIKLTISDNGKTVEAMSNQLISITFDLAAQTDKWELVAEPDPKVTRFLSSKFITPFRGAVGSVGSQEWQFHAVSPGSTSLRLRCSCTSNSEQAADEFNLTVTVK